MVVLPSLLLFFHLRKQALWLTRSARESKNIPIYPYLPFEMTFPSTKCSTSYLCLAIHFLKVPSLGKTMTLLR